MKPLTNLRTRFVLTNEPILREEALYNFEVDILNNSGLTVVRDTVFTKPFYYSDIRKAASRFLRKVFGEVSTLEHPGLYSCSESYSFRPHLSIFQEDDLYTCYLTSRDMDQKGIKLFLDLRKGAVQDRLWRILSYIYEDKLVNELIEGIE